MTQQFPTVVQNTQQHLSMELTTKCNARCRMCVHGYIPFGSTLQEQVVEKVLENQWPELKKLELCGLGEPLLSPQLLTIFRKFSERGMLLDTTSNGTLITAAIAQELVRMPLVLSISVDGASAEVFEWVRPGLRFERLLRGLEHLKTAALEAGSECRYRLHFYVVAMAANIHELRDTVRLAAEYGAAQVTVNILGGGQHYPYMQGQPLADHPELTTASLRDAWQEAQLLGIQLDVPHVYRQLYEKWQHVVGDRFIPPQPLEARQSEINLDEKTMWDLLPGEKRPDAPLEVPTVLVEETTEFFPLGEGDSVSPVTGLACSWPWKAFVVGIDATVNPCYSRIDLGNIEHRTLDDVWNGEGYQVLRKIIHGYNPPEQCRQCPLGFGIGGGDAQLFHRQFESHAEEYIRMDDPRLTFGPGCYHVEGAGESHPWMWAGRKFSLHVPNIGEPVEFLHIHLFEQLPKPGLHLGRARISGGDWHWFTTSAKSLILPAMGTQEDLYLEVEMQRSWRLGEDPRSLAIVLNGFSLLRREPAPQSD